MSPKALEEWQRKKSYHERQRTRYRHLISRANEQAAYKDPEQKSVLDSLEPSPSCPEEAILNSPVANSQTKTVEVSVSQSRANARSLYKSRYFDDIELTVTRCHYKLERQVSGGQLVSEADANLAKIGPPGTNITWRALSIIVTLTVSYAIPAHRLAKMLTNRFRAFSSGQITRLMQRAGNLCLPIYLELVDQLANAPCMYGDDSPTKVVEMGLSQDDEEAAANGLAARTHERLGRQALKADGSGKKKRLSVSVVSGQTDKDDRRSWIFLFRSHFGDLGNLLSRILQARRRKNRLVKLQTDLAAVNKLEKMISQFFDIVRGGCGAHARRGFWRYRDDDPGFCYFMLRGFALLAKVEAKLKKSQAGPEEIIRCRRRYSLRIWSIMLDRCLQVTGKIPLYGEGIHLNHWPKSSSVYKAAAYIVKNYQLLTAYFDHPEIFFTNNLSERLLRREKMMIVSSKFRKTENGRTVFDILQTITATCSAAGASLADYLPFLWEHFDDLEHHPHLYTPYAFVKFSDQLSSKKSSQANA